MRTGDNEIGKISFCALVRDTSLESLFFFYDGSFVDGKLYGYRHMTHTHTPYYFTFIWAVVHFARTFYFVRFSRRLVTILFLKDLCFYVYTSCVCFSFSVRCPTSDWTGFCGGIL